MANGCKISTREIQKSITDKGLAVAQSVDSTFRLSSIGELVLPLDSSNKSKDEPYKLRRIVNKTIRKINKELKLNPRKFGVVFGGVTYTDSAAIQVLVTPQLFASYQVKNQEKTIEQAFPKKEAPAFSRETAYRPSGFYKQDYALMEQELKDLEEQLSISTELPGMDKPADVKSEYVAPQPPVQLKLDLRLSEDQPPQKGDLGSIGFEEIACDV